jgi:hypothetical protein
MFNCDQWKQFDILWGLLFLLWQLAIQTIVLCLCLNFIVSLFCVLLCLCVFLLCLYECFFVSVCVLLFCLFMCLWYILCLSPTFFLFVLFHFHFNLWTGSVCPSVYFLFTVSVRQLLFKLLHEEVREFFIEGEWNGTTCVVINQVWAKLS